MAETIRCKAAVAWRPREPVIVEDVEVAPPKAGEVRIKILSTTVCHTDLNILDGFGFLDALGVFPSILGHEGAGIVESIGANVTTVSPGDHVIPLYIPQCYKCNSCLSGKANLCFVTLQTQNAGVMPDGTSRFTCNGKTIYHFMGCSTFSEYTVLPEISVCKINPTARLDRVCLLGCGVSTGYGAAINTAGVEKDSTCAVWGLGTVGLSVVMGCVEAGAKRIIGIDVNESKNEMGKAFGMTDFINPKNSDKSVQQLVTEMTDGGVDYSFECIGNVECMRAALESTHVGWGVSVVIGLSAMGEEISARPLNLVLGRVWKGSAFGGWKSRDSVPMLVQRYVDGKLKLDEFVTKEMPFSQINDVFELMNGGKCLRVILNHEHAATA